MHSHPCKHTHKELPARQAWGRHWFHVPGSLHRRISASGHLNRDKGASFYFPDIAQPSLIASAKYDYAQLLEHLLKWRWDQLVCCLPQRDTITIALMLLLECIRPPSNNKHAYEKERACLRCDWSVWWRFPYRELSPVTADVMKGQRRINKMWKSRDLDSSFPTIFWFESNISNNPTR